MKMLGRIIAVLLILCMVMSIVPPVIYVSAADADANLWVDPVNGKDTNNGTTAATALKTIAAAKTKAASLSASGDVVVILKGGVYDATTPITFSASHSGKNGNTITYRAAAGEEVLISGGEKLTDWTLYDEENNIYVADIPSAARLTRQFYVDSEPQPMARLENSPTDWEEITGGFSVPESYNLKDLWHPEYVELNTLYLWYHRVEHFTGINSDGTEIYEDTSCIPTWVANDYLFIDRTGEWYIDRDTNKIYYKADGTMDDKEAYLPVTEQVIEFDYASNITFEGVTISHTSYTHTSENRYLDQQANGHYYDDAWHQVPAGIEVTGCTNITFDSCDIRNMGTAGIRIKSDTSKMADGNSILNCRIYDISYSGIIVGEIYAHHGYESYQLVKNTTIKNNLITRIGLDMFDSPGIVATYTNGTVIDHNEISYTPYSGISLGWGWSNEETGSNTAAMNDLGDATVTNNYIHDVCKTNYDGGAFYSLGWNEGTVVSGNYIYNSGNGDTRGEISIYLDEGSCYMEIYDNVVGGQSSYWLQMYYSNIHDNYWHDNYYDSSISSRNYGKNNTITNNTAVKNGDFTQYSGAMAIIENAGLLDETLKEGMWEGFAHQHDIIQGFYSNNDRYIKPTAGWDNVAAPGQVGRTVSDSINGTISIVVDDSVDITALPLTFDLYEGWTCNKASGSVQDFTNPVVYTLKYGSTTVKWTVTVNQQVSSDEEIVGTDVDLGFAFESSSSGDWTSAPTNVSGGVMTHSGFSTYIGEMFSQESIFEFDLMIPLTSTGEWAAFTIKNQNPGTMCINGGTEYYIGFNTDDVEVQKFVNGERTVFFGQVDGYTPTYDVLPNNFFTPDEFHSIRVGAINVTGGVRIFMFVDGNLVLDITDFSNVITNDGYFSVYGMTKNINLRAFTDIQNTPDRTELDAIIAEAESIKATDYTAESYRNLQAALTQAEESLEAYGGVTQTMVDEAYAIIAAALDALEVENSGDTTDPTDPAEPTQPTTAPTQPTTTPTEPSTAPTEPATQPSEPATTPAVPATGTWLDAIPESSITPHVGDYLNGDLTTLKNEDFSEAKYLSDAHVGTAGWIGTKGKSSNKIQAVLFELNDTKTVGGIQLVGREGDYITVFDIEVKDTNGVWQTVKSVTEDPFTDSYTVNYTFDPVVGTEVRILIYDWEYAGSNNYPMLMEIAVFETKTGEALVKVPVSDITANKTPINSSKFPATEIFDGDRSGFFATQGSLPAVITANLTQEDGSPSNVARIKVYAYHGPKYTPKNIKLELQTTLDGEWIEVYSGNAYNSGFTDTFVLDLEQSYDAYAFRMTVNSTIGDYLILSEVELYGYDMIKVEGDIQLNAPTGLTATEITDSSITVTADAVTGGTLMFRINEGQWQTSGTFTGLDRYTKYTIEAMYVGAEGYLDSEMTSITERTEKTVLSAPAGLAATEITNSSITVTADAVTGGRLRYRINGGTWQTSDTFTGLTPNTTYTIEAMYVGSTGYIDSAVATIQVNTGKNQLSAPTGLKVVATDTIISASAGTVEGGTLMFRIDGGEWQTSGMFTGLTRNTEYTIEAMYVADEGYVDSGIVTVVTRTGKTYLNAPTNLTVSASDSTITVAADEVEGGTLMFRINGGEWQTSGEFTGLAPNTTYAVEAMYIGGEDYMDSDIASTTATTLDHSYEAVVTAPTCTEAGYTTYTCACGDTYTADEVPATGHTEVADENATHCDVCGEILRPIEPSQPELVETHAMAKNNYNVRLLEPWALRINVTFHKDASTALNPSTFKSYGAYGIIGYKYENADNATVENLINDPDAVKFEMSDVPAEGYIYPSTSTQLTFDFFDDLYTYRLSDTIYWVAYYEDADGNLHFTRVRNKTMPSAMDGTVGASDEVYAVFDSMRLMEETIIAYRGVATDLTSEYPAGVTIGETGINFATSPANSYRYSTRHSIKLIEPWGILVETKIVAATNTSKAIDYAAADDYGLIFYHDKTGKYDGMSVAQMLAETEAQVYSKTLGNTTITADGRVSAIYDQNIFTFEMDSNLYVLPFVIINGQCYYRDNGAINLNLIERLGVFANDASQTAEARAVYNAMIEMNTNIKIYRASLV